MIINNNKSPAAFLSLGFRPFFLGAGLFAFSAIALWMASYTFNYKLGINHLTLLQWHAHEMIYGYGMAVIAGFLLTAVTNWTGIKTLTGYSLLMLFALWVLARLLPFMQIENGLALMFTLDCLFGAYLVIALSIPVIKARQWKQIGIISKILLLLIANVVFYLGAMGYLEQGIHWGTYAGIYLILALVLMMARRVLPFFIEKSCGLTTPLINRPWLDNGSLIIFLFFMLSDIIDPYTWLTSLLATALALLHSLRLYHWHVKGIWNRPLLWILYTAYCFITLGFVLKAAVFLFDISGFLALHAFALGGISIMSIGMMARVSLGHTGRPVDKPPSALAWIFTFIVAAACMRVIMPMIDFQHYSLWIFISQLLWLCAFSGFVAVYFSVLTQKNVISDQ